MTHTPHASRKAQMAAGAPSSGLTRRLGRSGLLVAVCVVLMVGLVGCGGDDGDEASTPTATTAAVTDTPEATEQTPQPTATAEPEPTEEQPERSAFKTRTFTGQGDDVLRLKDPIEDVVLIETVHSGGNGNVVVETLGPDGETGDLVANGIGGEYRSLTITNLDIGTVIAAFEIRAPGSWTIKVKDITTARRWDGTGRLTGQSDDVIIIESGSFAPLDGLLYDAEGDSNFVVEAYTEDGFTDLVVNDIAPAQGESLMPSDVILIQVNADAAWTLRKGTG